jgi:hypothetical protein
MGRALNKDKVTEGRHKKPADIIKAFSSVNIYTVVQQLSQNRL